jgi:hypothetical protein
MVPPSGGTTFLPVQKDGEERTRQREGLFRAPFPLDSHPPKLAYPCAPNAPSLGPSLCSGLAAALRKEMSRPVDRALKWGTPNLPSGEGAARRRRKRDKPEGLQAFLTFPTGKVGAHVCGGLSSGRDICARTAITRPEQSEGPRA